MRYPETKYVKYIKEHRSISESKRGNAWFELSGGREMRDECGKDYYKGVVALSQKDTTSRDAIQIEKDLARYPRLSWYHVERSSRDGQT